MTSPPQESKIGLLILNIINTLTNICLGIICGGAMIFANQSHLPPALSQHIFLCVIGYIILMAQGVLSISSSTGWANSFGNQERKNIHWGMQILGSILAITGSAIRISSLHFHFLSVHAVFGMLALIFTLLTLIGGVMNLFFTNMNINANRIRICHAVFGCLTMLCAFLALIFGFDTNWYRLFLSSSNANMMIAFAFIALIGIILPATRNCCCRRVSK